ncbi:uncharacterized protein LOC109834938 [Asparagus officinalis]|uniref:uncharacterized protein LOC109834938 n=1 Tax=Asparagus officinalis TaxID=4686 RepID=UPI00098E6972|nr:uncharacterized protein LOC109834938 [Asparagus officinalis]
MEPLPRPHRAPMHQTDLPFAVHHLAISIQIQLDPVPSLIDPLRCSSKRHHHRVVDPLPLLHPHHQLLNPLRVVAFPPSPQVHHHHPCLEVTLLLRHAVPWCGDDGAVMAEPCVPDIGQVATRVAQGVVHEFLFDEGLDGFLFEGGDAEAEPREDELEEGSVVVVVVGGGDEEVEAEVVGARRVGEDGEDGGDEASQGVEVQGHGDVDVGIGAAVVVGVVGYRCS